MTRTLGYTQRVHVQAPVEEVWSYLADPRHHADLHPLVRELTILKEVEGPGPEQRLVEFEVLDGVKLLGFELPVRSRAYMILFPAIWTLSMGADSPPWVTTTVEWALSPTKDGTQIDEKVELTAPWLLAKFSIRLSQQAHVELFAALQRVLSASRQRARG